jgi:beta-1,4-N-acetylglucosaminyltransferase
MRARRPNGIAARLLGLLGYRHVGGPARRVLLVCSPGGHLQQMLALESAFDGLEKSLVTLPGRDVEELLDDRAYELANGPTNRDLRMLARNLPVAWRVIHDRDPDAVVSTGAGVCVPFFWIARLLGRRCIYVESLTRVESISLSARLVQPFATGFFVQWPGAVHNRRTRHVGSIL